MSEEFISFLQGSPDAFRSEICDPGLLTLRHASGRWNFGSQTLRAALSACTLDEWSNRVDFCLLNNASANATWYRVPEHYRDSKEDAYVIGVNVGLVEALKLVALDIFGFSDSTATISDAEARAAAERVGMRLGAFLELGSPLGPTDVEPVTPERRTLVDMLVTEALHFVVLHEVSHILLLHDRGNVGLRRNIHTGTQIATFSIGQEHQADQLAIRLHSGIRQSQSTEFLGIEFAGPTLLFGVLGLFERYTRYVEAFSTPNAHPPAYERLYRLRIALSRGDGHRYWAIPRNDGTLSLARYSLDANPSAVAFADSLSALLLRVLEVVEELPLYSPMLTLFNDICNGELNEEGVSQCCCEVLRWTLLGSPEKVIHHLAEAHRNAIFDLERASNNEDKRFLSNSIRVIDAIVTRLKRVKDYSVQDALRAFAEP